MQQHQKSKENITGVLIRFFNVLHGLQNKIVERGKSASNTESGLNIESCFKLESGKTKSHTTEKNQVVIFIFAEDDWVEIIFFKIHKSKGNIQVFIIPCQNVHHPTLQISMRKNTYKTKHTHDCLNNTASSLLKVCLIVY